MAYFMETDKQGNSTGALTNKGAWTIAAIALGFVGIVVAAALNHSGA
jgi:hypothetical protein